MPKPGYYAVRRGRRTGVFTSWTECEAQVKGYPTAQYKKFNSSAEATRFILEGAREGAGIGAREGTGTGAREGTGTGAGTGAGTGEGTGEGGGAGGARAGGAKGGGANRAGRTRGAETGIVAGAGAGGGAGVVNRGSGGSDMSVLQSNTPSTLISSNRSSKKKKGGFYAVRRGFSTGIFNNWADCEQQTRGFPGASFSKFQELSEAKAFLAESLPPLPTTDIQSELKIKPKQEQIIPPSKEPLSLSTEQYKGLQRILDGHNVFLSGSAGTGKSFLVQVLRDIYLARGKMGLLAVTASTGCAACGIKGQTIHAWAGVGTGLGSDLTAEDLFMKLGKQNKRNWVVTRVLLIDEISMISAKDLDKLSELACIARNNLSQPFGGMQVILCGDFLQLPPVSKPQHPATFCFESKVWQQLFPPSSGLDNMIILSTIQRQKDRIFQRILNSLRIGTVSPEVDWFLRRKSVLPKTPMPPHNNLILSSGSGCDGDTCSSPWFTGKRGILSSQSVKLYSRVADVKRVNTFYLNSLPSADTVTITARDGVPLNQMDAEGPQSSLMKRLDQEVPAPKSLDLKVGAQVMLIANLDTKIGLVNGALGHVIRFESQIDEASGVDVILPVVRFAILSSNLPGAEEEKRRMKGAMKTRLSEYNRGYKILSSMGYTAWDGLGKDKEGSPDPVECALSNQCSIGLSSNTVNATVERTLEYYSFHLKNSYEKTLAIRQQVPLILAYAITIHKTQGMSIPDVEVNMDGIFTTGQAYVALSRATNAEGLKVTGYNKSLVYSNPNAVRFYDNIKNRIQRKSEIEQIPSKKESDNYSRLSSSAPEVVVTSIYEMCNGVTS